MFIERSEGDERESIWKRDGERKKDGGRNWHHVILNGYGEFGKEWR
jgi:hypothetical protein